MTSILGYVRSLGQLNVGSHNVKSSAVPARSQSGIPLNTYDKRTDVYQEQEKKSCGIQPRTKWKDGPAQSKDQR